MNSFREVYVAGFMCRSLVAIRYTACAYLKNKQYDKETIHRDD
jgi:hypothetical protein